MLLANGAPGAPQTLALCTGIGTPAATCAGASPAIGAATSGEGPATDERGVPRPGGAEACDVGAFEFDPLSSLLFEDRFGTGDTSRWSSVAGL